MKEIDPKALFRLSVLGPLVSRERLERGELQQLIRELAQREYTIPGSRRHLLGEKTIQAWYYTWRRRGIEGLVPKVRVDRGQSRLAQLQYRHPDHGPIEGLAELGQFRRQRGRE